MALPGQTPTSPLTFVGAGTVEVLVTVEPAKMPKPQPAGPIGMDPGQATVAVVNIQLKSAAKAMPNWSWAAVVIVAV